MKYQDYEIEPYQSGQREEVVELLGQLLEGDPVTNDAYFGWEYEQNPHAEDLLGIVAKHQGKVVGFRGYGSSLWHRGTGKTTRTLIPGDTCVDLNHRKQGLSVRSFLVLSIFAHSVDSTIGTSIQRLGFHAGGIMGAMERKVRGNMPLLVRPVTAEPGENDWYVDGADVRNPANWLIKGICSDAT